MLRIVRLPPPANTPMQHAELVPVHVPRHRLAEVYRLLGMPPANVKGGPGGPDRPGPGNRGPGPRKNGRGKGFEAPVRDAEGNVWTQEFLDKVVRQSPPGARQILGALCKRPGEWLDSQALADALTDKPNADWMAVAGTLGALNRRLKNRYGLDGEKPYETRFDHDRNGRVLRMSTDIAEKVRKSLNRAGDEKGNA